jgi:PKD repeat protein
MTRRVLSLLAVVAAIGTAACGVHQAAEPSLTGPSGLATALTVTATPDSISQDGAARATVTVLANDAAGRPLSGLSVRVDMAVGGVLKDYGTLSARNLVTGSGGQATAIYTSPAAPPPSAAGQVSTVTIVATPVGTDAQSKQSFTADIRLVPVGVILPPAGTPTASFVVSPTPVNQNVAVTFDGSASGAGTNATQITSYSWSFGDGATAQGATVTHAYTQTGSFTATLTVTNDRTIQASTSQTVAVSASVAPVASFVFSPAAPLVNQNVVFNGDTSKASAGHTITQFSWNFGDGATASGFTANHTYSQLGTFNVTLSVVDEAGQKGSVSQAVTVTLGGVANGPTAVFVTSIGSPVVGDTIVFNATQSQAAPGHTIRRYDWNFGDGSAVVEVSDQSVSHKYLKDGTYTVTLLVTDDLTQQASTSKGITVGTGNPVPVITSSTTTPVSNVTLVSFDTNSSTTSSGAHVVSWSWDFGDPTSGASNTSTAASPTHTFLTTGPHTVRVTITDDASPSRSGTTTITITAS